jgi:hypothetical protein
LGLDVLPFSPSDWVGNTTPPRTTVEMNRSRQFCPAQAGGVLKMPQALGTEGYAR